MLENKTESPNPSLSIVVLNRNLGNMTRECIESIRTHTLGVTYEILVVDNGSAPNERQVVRQACEIHKARLIELNQNVFFGEANNIGAEAARGEFLLLLNNDVVVTSGYILPMLHALQNAHRAGAVGAELRFPDGRLQEAGGYVRQDGWTIRHGLERGPADILSKPGLHIVDYCSAACLLFRRNVFLGLGGFDPLFDPAYFEDVDLAMRLRGIGLFTYFLAGNPVIHRESATSKAIWKTRHRKAITHRNHRKFVERWGEFIANRVFCDAIPPRFERINWLSESPPHTHVSLIFLQGPGLISLNRTWFDIIRIAASLPDKVHVVFVADEVCSRCRIYVMARDLGLRLQEFSVQRASDITPHPTDTAVIFHPQHACTEVASGYGPLLVHVADHLIGLN